MQHSPFHFRFHSFWIPPPPLPQNPLPRFTWLGETGSFLVFWFSEDLEENQENHCRWQLFVSKRCSAGTSQKLHSSAILKRWGVVGFRGFFGQWGFLEFDLWPFCSPLRAITKLFFPQHLSSVPQAHQQTFVHVIYSCRKHRITGEQVM